MEGNKVIGFNNFFMKQRNLVAVAVLLFIPLFFIGTRSSHDWGDDFAQYIHQAINIVNGIPQSETGFVYSQENYIGPQAYPVGFPLMLSPVYALAGNNLKAFTGFITFIYIVLGLFMLVFYRRYFTPVTSLILVMIFLFNPQMIIFKREVMSDIPFAALLVLNFILYNKFKNGGIKHFIFLTFFTGIMLIVRPAGVVFIAAVMMDQLIAIISTKKINKEVASKLFASLIIPLFLYFLVNSVLFNIPSAGSVRDYLLFYYSGDFLQIIPLNFEHHIEVFRYLYVPEAGFLRGISLLLGSFMVVMTIIGFVKQFMEGPKVTEWFFIFYCLMLLVFPNNYSAFRLMVPLGFLFLFYATHGIKSISLIKNMPAWKKAVPAGILVLVLFIPGLIKIGHSGNNTLEGPQQKVAVDLFSYMQKHVEPQSIVVFAKPRALALYAGCKGMADPFTTDPTKIHKQVYEAGATHLLVSNRITTEAMKRYAHVMNDRLTKQFENKEFTLYKINQSIPR